MSSSKLRTSGYLELCEKAQAEYPKIDRFRLAAEAERLKFVFPKAAQLVRKQILDIGSGAIESPDAPLGLGKLIFGKIWPRNTVFDPWYCRIAHLGGAQVYGIDIGASPGENYSHIQADLLEEGSLLDTMKLSGVSNLDHINNYKFTTEPDSRHAVGGTSPHIAIKQLGMSPDGSKDNNGFLRGIDYESLFNLNEKIRQQVLQLLKEGGTYLHGEFLYRKKGGSLSRVKTMQGFGS
ncbi:hypothetical protein KA071_02400 [Candidatus Gracilibacteria bacterium]|nr:hypothetical protein [Candidatus Gracilibacteria bacterium]